MTDSIVVVGPGPGSSPVGAKGIAALAVYFTVLATFLIYSVIALWPTAPDPSTTDLVKTPPKVAAAAAGASGARVAACEEDRCPSHYFGATVALTSEQRLIVIVLLCGAFGGLLHGIRSLTWYAGNRNLVRSWALTYLLMPAVGALLALVFFFVLSAGLFVGPSSLATAKTSGFAAIAVLVGLFNVQA